MAMALRADVASPLGARNDVEGDAKDADKADKKDDETKDADKKDEAKKNDGAKDDSKKGDAKEGASAKSDTDKAEKKDTPKPVAIDLDGLDAPRRRRCRPRPATTAASPPSPARCSTAASPRTGSGEEKAALVYYDLDGARGEDRARRAPRPSRRPPTARSCSCYNDKKFGFVDVKAAQKLEKPLRTGELETTVDPKAEWTQMFADAFRFQRDFFYDPGLHGVDWPALRTRYQALIDAAVTRWDVNFVLGDFMGELNASHTYRGGGDVEKAVEARRRRARRRLGARERRLPHHAHRRRRDLGRRCALAAARPGRQRQGGRLRPGRQRRAAAHRTRIRWPPSRGSPTRR